MYRSPEVLNYIREKKKEKRKKRGNWNREEKKREDQLGPKEWKLLNREKVEPWKRRAEKRREEKTHAVDDVVDLFELGGAELDEACVDVLGQVLDGDAKRAVEKVRKALALARKSCPF